MLGDLDDSWSDEVEEDMADRLGVEAEVVGADGTGPLEGGGGGGSSGVEVSSQATKYRTIEEWFSRDKALTYRVVWGSKSIAILLVERSDQDSLLGTPCSRCPLAEA